MLFKRTSLYYISKFPPLVKDKEERGLPWHRNEQCNYSATPVVLGVSPAWVVLFSNGYLLLLICPGHRDAYPTCEVVEVQLCYNVAKLIYLCRER